MAGQTSFTQEAADRICDELSAGRSLRSICLDGDMPSQSTVFRWLRDEAHEEFRQQYARARDNQADTHADEILGMADDGSNAYRSEERRGGNEGGSTGDSRWSSALKPKNKKNI